MPIIYWRRSLRTQWLLLSKLESTDWKPEEPQILLLPPRPSSTEKRHCPHRGIWKWCIPTITIGGDYISLHNSENKQIYQPSVSSEVSKPLPFTDSSGARMIQSLMNCHACNRYGNHRTACGNQVAIHLWTTPTAHYRKDSLWRLSWPSWELQNSLWTSLKETTFTDVSTRCSSHLQCPEDD